MSWFRQIREQHLRVAIAAVGGLLVASIIAGLVGLLVNQSVERVTDQALRYDIELEDEADDLRVAILDMRHYHRNIAFTGPSRNGIADFEAAYERLQDEIDELEDIGVPASGDIQAEEFRQMAEEYYAGFRPAVDAYEEDPEAFVQTSDRTAGAVRVDRRPRRGRRGAGVLGGTRGRRAQEAVRRAAGNGKEAG